MNVNSTIIHNCSKLGVMKQPSMGTWIHLLVWFIHSMEYCLVIGRNELQRHEKMFQP